MNIHDKIADMISAIDPEIKLQAVKRAEPPTQPQFYVHINRRRLQIVAITRQQLEYSDNAEVISVEINYDLAEKFLKGIENPTKWIAVYKDDKYTIVRESEIRKNHTSRVDVLPIFEVTDVFNFADISIEADVKNNIVKIHYNGESIKHWARPAKLYFTREGDPSHLKCAFTLDINILNKIVEMNELDGWPNPIIFPLSDVDDLSIYTAKSDIRISKYETVNYGI